MGFIYKIYCKDSNIKDFYIGKTQEIKCRMSQHKSACIRNNTNSYLYKFINLYGGWNNWDYEIIQEVTNKKIDLGDIENEYLLIYKPTLNTQQPTLEFGIKKDYNQTIKKKKVICKCGDEYWDTEFIKHKKICMWKVGRDEINKLKTELNRTIQISCYCGAIVCKGSLTRHLRSNKHLKLTP